MTALRNVAIIAALAAAVAFLPGGGTGAAVIGGVLSTLILVSLVLIVARMYREHPYDLDALGDRWRGVLYGAVGLIVLMLAARDRLADSGPGTLLLIGSLAASAYALYLVWRRHRAYD